jgi:hypothetical protein
MNNKIKRHSFNLVDSKGLDFLKVEQTSSDALTINLPQKRKHVYGVRHFFSQLVN